jgi:hypothetical protein
VVATVFVHPEPKLFSTVWRFVIVPLSSQRAASLLPLVSVSSPTLYRDELIWLASAGALIVAVWRTVAMPPGVQ